MTLTTEAIVCENRPIPVAANPSEEGFASEAGIY